MIAKIPIPTALNSPIITTSLCNNHNSSFSSLSSPAPLIIRHRRRRSRIRAASLVLPLLPFPTDQVLVPSETKTLHLYEARYIALLDESIFQKNKLFVHFVLDPIGFTVASSEASFAARFGCLVAVEKVEQLKIGALVLIRGVGRVNVLKFKQMQPYLTGEVTPLQDKVSHNMTEICSKALELKEALHSLNSLEIKLKTPPEAQLQTQTTNSLSWAEKEVSLDCITDYIPPVAERVSFAALQPVSGASQSELIKLQKEKLRAMEVRDTLERLENSVELVRNNIAIVAAKLAIQSVQVQP